MLTQLGNEEKNPLYSKVDVNVQNIKGLLGTTGTSMEAAPGAYGAPANNNQNKRMLSGKSVAKILKGWLRGVVKLMPFGTFGLGYSKSVPEMIRENFYKKQE
ncbi:unnamed protein product, partial [Amoebophrya sp. A25]|eukprot:GSA25T00017285001.1